MPLLLFYFFRKEIALMNPLFSKGFGIDKKFEYIQMIYQIVTTVPFVTGAIRRLHDMGKTGWFMLLAFIPFIGWVALAMMLCTASNPEANRFGENPYEEGYYHL